MSYMTKDERTILVQQLLETLCNKGLSYNQIQGLLEDRVNARTLYRWAKGEVSPQRDADIFALQKLVEDLS